ncbi:uncharacterized protein LOC128389581 [Panonychus citri]|uniref:uncharacterized protein LOC128388794 n=1 Tax=Panonychus citri TaxID=50023 RepID=UPI0023082540|nr:uncharacterized protein LOC128388794 [Panonychus citri]XP_053205167.1 uncharacterized protein LOC128389581 [Panonychus citri]
MKMFLSVVYLIIVIVVNHSETKAIEPEDKPSTPNDSDNSDYQIVQQIKTLPGKQSANDVKKRIAEMFKECINSYKEKLTNLVNYIEANSTGGENNFVVRLIREKIKFLDFIVKL